MEGTLEGLLLARGCSWRGRVGAVSVGEGEANVGVDDMAASD